MIILHKTDTPEILEVSEGYVLLTVLNVDFGLRLEKEN